MELTRRDAAAALAALGASGGVALGARFAADRGREGDEELGADGTADEPSTGDETVRETLTAVASVVYPSDVTGVDEFVEGFLAGRLDGSAHATGLREAVAELNHLANSWHGAPVVDLDPADRDRLLREVGADEADEDPDGTTAERVRYYVVNELLLALYASPTGGELVGIENPQGHPGGAESYRRGPR
ncbi:gluconate 2-dehydrogenase subunit 3 family protein [Halorubrum sp. 2020YC2]|uniref:gluconate 2-dehydrogenase subunit 3 family protein n=1 Tax=Halorubrum sp. 2020YC2 TaxID=2836432 RepID=UPI001BEA170C|nr:gluconate 2-dehydrogenase subunit 3 family protein [Halorubrum sp. 2020YC2]QWC19283.1 gluconate 2-dehydrogenase subunit 3 family protein [Halorubrum sp. 2020YC2]